MRQRIIVVTESTRTIGIVSEFIGMLGIGVFYPLMAFGNELAAYLSLLCGGMGFSVLGLCIKRRMLLLANIWAVGWVAKILIGG